MPNAVRPPAITEAEYVRRCLRFAVPTIEQARAEAAAGHFAARAARWAYQLSYFGEDGFAPDGCGAMLTGPCVVCGTSTGGWCDGCEQQGRQFIHRTTEQVFAGLPYCTSCENHGAICPFCVPPPGGPPQLLVDIPSDCAPPSARYDVHFDSDRPPSENNADWQWFAEQWFASQGAAQTGHFSMAA